MFSINNVEEVSSQELSEVREITLWSAPFDGIQTSFMEIQSVVSGPSDEFRGGSSDITAHGPVFSNSQIHQMQVLIHTPVQKVVCLWSDVPAKSSTEGVLTIIRFKMNSVSMSEVFYVFKSQQKILR